jgi:hypothetical protein
VNAQWALSGNAITSGQFLGTTNAQNLVFKANNSNAGFIDVSYANTAFGLNSLNTSSATASQNSAFGNYALQQNSTGYANTAVGYLSLPQNNSGNTNTGVGEETMYDNTSGYSNTGMGALALYHNTTGYDNNAYGGNALFGNTTGIYNNAFGCYALYSNINGNYNCAMGHQALYSNTSGSDNIGIGLFSAYYNSTGGSNIAVGNRSLYNNTTGSYNVAIGVQALYSNGTGSDNTAVGFQALAGSTASNNSAFGYQALYSNSSGANNTALGYSALYNNSTGSDNVGIGDGAGSYNTTGTENTWVGEGSGPLEANPNLTNSTAIGWYTVSTASNQVVLGNQNVTQIGGYANWSMLSDGRFKKNIQENVPGLEFIMLLRPVTYNLDISGLTSFLNSSQGAGAAGRTKAPTAEEQSAMQQKEKMLCTGFIAQEVETAAKKISYDFSGVVVPQDSRGLYGLAYADFVVPLVRSVQQLSNKHDSLSSIVDSLQSQINDIQQEINNLKAAGGNSINGAALRQNMPNPFNSNTIISYFIPAGATSSQLIISDAGGQIIKTFGISSQGEGLTTIYAGELASGIYFYTLIVNGNKIDTKKMVITK